MIDEAVILKKIIAMFRPYGDEEFLDFPGSETICGPNDRAMIGYDTNFPKVWLIDDFGFTKEEAEWFIKSVQEMTR